MAKSASRWLQTAWYSDEAPIVLKPLSALFGRVANKRRAEYQSGNKVVTKLPVPVIIVGNISVGGTGKTPLVAAIVCWLQQQGWQPGIVSRGYGGNAAQYPHRVESVTDTAASGDEACLLQQLTGVPVVVAPKRAEAGAALVAEGCDIIVADDGLQHYALARDIEIAVVDGERGLGNGLLLPAGPLREPPERLTEVDFVVVNGPLTGPLAVNVETATMHFVQAPPLGNEARANWSEWQDQLVHGVAGTGNPGRFFSQLRERGLQVEEHAFDDHHNYQASDLNFADGLPVLMTSKDAVKCRAFWQNNFFEVPIAAELADEFFADLREKLNQVLALSGD